MGETTGISWAGGTWNPWMGCTKKSEGCKNCYMFRDAARYGWDPTVVRRSKTKFNDILNRKEWPSGKTVFTCSWSDFFHPGADEWRPEAWDLIRQRPDLILLILTKLPERILDHLPADWGDGWPNVWMGVTAENQRRADERIPLLLKVPAAVHFVSCGPLLGPVDLGELAWASLRQEVRGDWPIGHDTVAAAGVHRASINQNGAVSAILPDGYLGIKPHEMEWAGKIDLVITEGESGSESRPTHPDWFRMVRDQCAKYGIAYHHKQHGEWVCVYDRDREDPDWRNTPKPAPGEQWLNLAGGQGYHGERVVLMRRVGVKAAGRLLDGKVWDQMPQVGG